jgi:Mn2+/Fe2+ NRAMP family transporter
LNKDYILAAVAILGTTISPYLFFWRAEEEVDEQQEKPEKSPLKDAPKQAPSEFYRIRIDTYFGMVLSNLVALFIVITTATTLNAHGVTDIQTSAQAAQALKPIAGPFAFAVFACGIIGTGLLALTVLAGSAAYSLGEAMHWPVGLAKKAGRARGFYLTIAISTVVGAAMNFSPIDPVKALFWSAVINGIVAVPVMVIMMLMTHRQDVMGEFAIPPVLRGVGWLATVVMGATVVGLAVTSFI